VRLREFEVRVGDFAETVPWVHLPVAPTVIDVDGVRTVVVDEARSHVGVRPVFVRDLAPDADWADDGGDAPDSSDDDTPRRRKNGRRARYEPSPSPDEQDGAGDGAADNADAECARCGMGGHPEAACPDFPSERGASHRLPGALDLGSQAPGCSVRSTLPAPSDGGNDSVFAALHAALQNAVPGAPAVTRSSLRAWLTAPRAARTSVLGRTFAEWIKLESEHRWTVKDYLARLSGGCFGGVLEIAMCSVSRELCIDVWRESSHGRLVLVAAFGHADGRSSRLVLNLLHMQGRRYAALLGLQSRRLRT
jgi:hypothetical protein